MIKQVPAQEEQLGPGGLLVAVKERRVVPAGIRTSSPRGTRCAARVAGPASAV
jgi:hypothetical protein